MDGIQDLTDKNLLDWDEADVHQWFSYLGFSQYERQIKEHKIQGDSLCMLDSEGLKSFGITTIGQRLSILKSIYLLKLANDIPFNEDDYIPPSETISTSSISLEQIHANVKDQATRLRALEEDNRTLTLAMRSFSEEIIKLRPTVGLSDEPAAQIQKRLPDRRSEAKSFSASTKTSEEFNQGTPSLVSSSEGSTLLNSSATPSGQDSSDSLGNTKVSLDDPTWKVLPAALKKHRINTDEWPNYAMFISYGPVGNRTKRRLETNEKPLYLFKKLKEAQKNPAFVLKNMKDPRSPAEFENSATEPQPQINSFAGTIHNRNQSYPTPPMSRPSLGF